MRQSRLRSIFDGTLLVTDGGLETTLIFQDGLDLPHFAAFPLLDSELGRTTCAGITMPMERQPRTAVPVAYLTPRPFGSVPIGQQSSAMTSQHCQE